MVPTPEVKNTTFQKQEVIRSVVGKFDHENKKMTKTEQAKNFPLVTNKLSRKQRCRGRDKLQKQVLTLNFFKFLKVETAF